MLPQPRTASTRFAYQPESSLVAAQSDTGRRRERIRSIDVARGVVMVLMALDHVRVYAGVPAGGPTPALFFTRWITNFCAPAFFFLAGTGAYLYGRQIENRPALARWLLVRGLWLVLLELTVIRFAWTFNFDYAHYVLGGVIWSLGWCMVLMSALVFLPLSVIAGVGVAVIALHNAVMPLVAQSDPRIAAGQGPWLWNVLYFGGPITSDAPLILLYSIIPWIGVMAAGYAFGAVMRMEPSRRDRICIALGASAVIAFLVLRGTDVYGDPRPWSRAPDGARNMAPSWIRFLNTAKYPASLSFLLMTLGPMLLLLPLLERARGRLATALAVFGRVPLFFYLLHIPLIHVTALLLSWSRQDGGGGWLIGNHPVAVGPPPDGYQWGLGRLYLVWLLVVVALYAPCRWFAVLRARRPEGILRYL
ncbi:MAG: DUF1624 domain-containing protein [Gemmatimonadaceae bacterium]